MSWPSLIEQLILQTTPNIQLHPLLHQLISDGSRQSMIHVQYSKNKQEEHTSLPKVQSKLINKLI